MSPTVLRSVIIVWLWLEIGLAIHNRIARRGAAIKDSGSKLVIAVAIIIGLVLAFRVRAIEAARIPRTNDLPIYLAGILIAVGFVIRLTAVINLRGSFTTTVTVSPDQKLIRGGLYTHIRHPGYLGSLIIFCGIGLSFRSWLSLLVLLGCVVPAFLYRIYVEERALAERFGDEYHRYANGTKRIIPGIF